MDPELLCAVHVIAHFLDGIEERIEMPAGGPFGEESMAEIELIALRTEILDGLLWGWTTYGKLQTFTDAVRVMEPVFQSLFRLLKKENLGDLEINISLNSDEIAEYEKTSVISSLSSKRQKGKKLSQLQLWEKVRQGKWVTITMADDPEFINALLKARSEIVMANFVNYDVSELYLRKTVQRVPIHINYLSQPQKVREILREIEFKYLDGFVAGKILWGDNPLNWTKQVEYFLPILNDLYSARGDCWVSWIEWNGKDWKEMGEYKLIETLFSLQRRGDLEITRYQHHWSRDIRFRVRILKKSIPQPAPGAIKPKREPIQYETVRTDFHNIWSIDEKRKERFNEGGARSLLELLHKNIGKKIEKKSVTDFESVFEGLLQKLVRVSGQTRDEVQGWFDRDKINISLKMPKKT